jgi:ABC-2 type transport system ATP-binding protein
MDDVAIRVEGVYKDFQLPHEKVGSIKGIFTHLVSYISSARSYETQHALKDVSLDVKKGEFFGIVGRNGSGKSTLLKMLAGIYQPSLGKISVNGRLVPFIELGVGFSPELTGKQNVYLNGALLGFSEKEIDSQYDDIVEFAELKPFMDQKLKNYSSGMQVRLAFSMAVRAKADILLIDEVLAVGDADFQRKCFEYFKKLKKESTTVIFVSHNMDAVREYCDRAMLIEKSKVIEIGTTNSVANKYLRLFMKEDNSNKQKAKEKERWGDGFVKLTKVSVKVDEKQLIISETIEACQDIEAPVAGFRIRDAAGKDVTGTNTKVEQKSLHNLVKGEKVVVEWTLPNIFSDGEYTLDPALLHSDGVTVSDWWDGAAAITIKKSRRLPYAIDPGFNTKVTILQND